MTALLLQLQTASVLFFLVSSMAAMGLALTPGELAAPLREGRFVALALALNFALAPACSWLLTIVLPLDPGHAAGLLLLGGAAGAPFLPKLVETARADRAHAAALMALLTAGTIVFLPFTLPLLIPGFSADPWKLARPLLLLVALPLAVGMVINYRAKRIAALAAPWLARVGNAALLLLFVLLVALNVHALLGVIGSGAVLAALILFTVLFAAGWQFGGTHRAELGLATTARNFGAALAPAANCFSDPSVTVMIIVGAIVCLVVSFAAAVWARRRITSS